MTASGLSKRLSTEANGLASKSRSMPDALRWAHQFSLRWAALLAFVVLWEVVSLTGVVSRVLLPSPISVATAAWRASSDGTLWPNVGASVARAAAGFLLATATAIPLGILAGWYKPISLLLDPLVDFFKSIPVLALLPMAILWFGIGETSKVFLVTYGAFFPIFINTVAGVRGVDPILIRAALSLGASNAQIFRRVALKAATPDVLTGLRLGTAFSLLTLVAAEQIASTSGLGFMIVDAQATFHSDVMLVGTLMFGALGLTTAAILGLFEKRLLRWKQEIGAGKRVG